MISPVITFPTYAERAGFAIGDRVQIRPTSAREGDVGEVRTLRGVVLEVVFADGTRQYYRYPEVVLV